jgi:GNAT superfamily N-acetyltransferase
MIDVRELTEADFGRAQALPLHRFAGFRDDATYLVAWDGDLAVGHVHVAWARTELGAPELQDMYVLPERRGTGIGTALARAAEELAQARGHDRCSLSVSEANGDARRLYERLGYAATDTPPKRVVGTVQVRGGSIDVDDTIVYLAKDLSISPPPVRRTR